MTNLQELAHKKSLRPKIFITLALIIFVFNIFMFFGPSLFPQLRHLFPESSADCNDCGVIFVFTVLLPWLVISTLLIIIFLLIALVPGKQKKVGWVLLAIFLGILTPLAYLFPTITDTISLKIASLKTYEMSPQLVNVQLKSLTTAQPIFKNGMILSSVPSVQTGPIKRYYFLKYTELNNLEEVKRFSGQELKFSKDKQWIADYTENNWSSPTSEINIYHQGSNKYWQISFSKNYPAHKNVTLINPSFSSDSKQLIFSLTGLACLNNKPCFNLQEGVGYSGDDYKNFTTEFVFDIKSSKFLKYTPKKIDRSYPLSKISYPVINLHVLFASQSKDSRGNFIFSFQNQKYLVENTYVEKSRKDNLKNLIHLAAHSVSESGIISDRTSILDVDLSSNQAIFALSPSNPTFPQGQNASLDYVRTLSNDAIVIICRTDQIEGLNQGMLFYLLKDNQLSLLPKILGPSYEKQLIQDF